jgi:hypothetical protein
MKETGTPTMSDYEDEENLELTEDPGEEGEAPSQKLDSSAKQTANADKSDSDGPTAMEVSLPERPNKISVGRKAGSGKEASPVSMHANAALHATQQGRTTQGVDLGAAKGKGPLISSAQARKAVRSAEVRAGFGKKGAVALRSARPSPLGPSSLRKRPAGISFREHTAMQSDDDDDSSLEGSPKRGRNDAEAGPSGIRSMHAALDLQCMQALIMPCMLTRRSECLRQGRLAFVVCMTNLLCMRAMFMPCMPTLDLQCLRALIHDRECMHWNWN